MGLYYNMRRMVTIFCAAIGIITVCLLALRLTVFSDMELAASPAMAQAELLQPGEIEGSDFPYTINSKIYFEDAAKSGNLLIQNPEGNKYILGVNIILPDTKVSLYYNGSIMPGEGVETAYMSEAGQRLMQGNYECTAEISARDPETYKIVAQEKKPVTIQIGK